MQIFLRLGGTGSATSSWRVESLQSGVLTRLGPNGRVAVASALGRWLRLDAGWCPRGPEYGLRSLRRLCLRGRRLRRSSLEGGDHEGAIAIPGQQLHASGTAVFRPAFQGVGQNRPALLAPVLFQQVARHDVREGDLQCGGVVEEETALALLGDLVDELGSGGLRGERGLERLVALVADTDTDTDQPALVELRGLGA